MRGVVPDASQQSRGNWWYVSFFFKNFGVLLGGVWSSLDFLNHGNLPSDINDTTIVLIPKVSNPGKVSNFRPLASATWCIRLYSVTLSNRLKVVLPHIISRNQSAYVPSHLITDNIGVTFEMMHFLEHHKSTQKGYAAIKLDVAKAYDGVERSYLEVVVLKMGFSGRCVDRVMMCVTSTSFGILVIREIVGSISPSRGIQQGEPLSYISLFCMWRDFHRSLSKLSFTRRYMVLERIGGCQVYHTSCL